MKYGLVASPFHHGHNIIYSLLKTICLFVVANGEKQEDRSN